MSLQVALLQCLPLVFHAAVAVVVIRPLLPSMLLWWLSVLVVVWVGFPATARADVGFGSSLLADVVWLCGCSLCCHKSVRQA